MRRLWGAVVALVVTVCATTAPPALSAIGSADWTTYAYNNQRTGFNPAEHALGSSAVKSLHLLWSTRLGAPVLTQPVVASRVLLRHPRRVVDLVFAATEHGRIAAMNAGTGRVVWSRHFPYEHVPFCGDLPNHDFGISGTPVIDRARHSIFVMNGDGRLYELDLRTGRTKRRWTLTIDPQHNYDYGALTLAGGTLYVPFAGNCDTVPWHGFVAAIGVRNGRILNKWFPVGGLNGGGIWGYGGVSADPGGSIFAGIGNSQGSSMHAALGENVVRLTHGLSVVAANYPGLPRGDADFGATPTLFQRSGCPPQLAIGNKYGSFFVYNRGGISGGPVQRIQLGGSAFGQNALIGVAAYWPRTAAVLVSNPNDAGGYTHGIDAFQVTGGCRLSLSWSASYGPAELNSSPTIADGVVYLGLSGGVAAHVVAFDASNGHLLWTSRHAVKTSVFAAPTVVNGKVYVSSSGGYVTVFGR